MRRVVALLVPFAVLIATIGTVGVLEARRLPDWRLELDRYLEATGRPSETVAVQSVVQARRPWNLAPDIVSTASMDPTWQSIDVPPPSNVRCVLLERVRYSPATAGEWRTQEVVLLGYHTDLLWKDGWIVYELTSDWCTPESHQALAQVGCDLGFKGGSAGSTDGKRG
jgi:hypothetical protein